MNNESIEQYIEFLWMQFQYDWGMFTNPWVLYTVIPAAAYLEFFVVKWYVLLAPITIPITIFNSSRPDRAANSIRNELSDRLK